MNADEQVPVNEPPLVVKVKAAAAMLSVSRSHVYKLMDSGQLAYVKLNGARRIEPAAIKRLIAAGRVGGEHTPAATK
jgi:excisionase family DNA binding protein